jgi:hypothetical protein
MRGHTAPIPVTTKAIRKIAWGTCNALLKGVRLSWEKRKYAQAGIKGTNVITTEMKMYGTWIATMTLRPCEHGHDADTLHAQGM